LPSHLAFLPEPDAARFFVWMVGGAGAPAEVAAFASLRERGAPARARVVDAAGEVREAGGVAVPMLEALPVLSELESGRLERAPPPRRVEPRRVEPRRVEPRRESRSRSPAASGSCRAWPAGERAGASHSRRARTENASPRSPAPCRRPRKPCRSMTSRGADRHLEDRAHRRVVDLVRMQVDVLESLDDLEEETCLFEAC
jgi:hypothetical protein